MTWVIPDAYCADECISLARNEEATQLLQSAHTWYPEDALVAERLAMQYLATDASHLAVSVINEFANRLLREYEVPLPESLSALRRRLSTSGGSKAVGSTRPISSSAHDPLVELASPPSATASVLQAHQDPALPAALGITGKWRKRTATLLLTAVLLTSVAYGVGHVERQSVAEEPTPTTLGELYSAAAQARIAARLELFDSAHIGRIIILPPKNQTGDSRIDSALPRISRELHSALGADLRWATSYAQVLPETTSARLASEAEATSHRVTPRNLLHEASIFSTFRPYLLADTIGAGWTPEASDRMWPRVGTSVLFFTGAPFAIQPLIQPVGKDSIRVSFLFHRAYHSTVEGHTGSWSAESHLFPATDGIGPNLTESVREASRHLAAFVVSMESCRPAEHASETSSPWCWTKGRQLRVALTPKQQVELEDTRRARLR